MKREYRDDLTVEKLREEVNKPYSKRAGVYKDPPIPIEPVTPVYLSALARAHYKYLHEKYGDEFERRYGPGLNHEQLDIIRNYLVFKEAEGSKDPFSELEVFCRTFLEIADNHTPTKVDEHQEVTPKKTSQW